MSDTTLAMAERHVAELEQRIVQQKARIDGMARENRPKREADLARSVLATFETSLQRAQEHLRFERQHRWQI